MIAATAAVVAEWWTTYVEGRTPPPADGHRATTSALAAASLDPVQVPAVDVSALTETIDELAGLRAACKQLDADIERDENLIRAALGGHTEGVVDGQVVVSWRQQQRAAYTVPESTYRVLRLHKPRRSR